MLPILLLLLFLLEPAQASKGDIHPSFAVCMSRCVATPAVCSNTARTLLLFPWTCEDECKYECMHQIESEMAQLRAPVQYYGKWPFKRFLGVQEPLSTLFSLLNGYPHAVWLLTPSLRQKYAPEEEKGVYRSVLLFSSVVGINTWWWSAVFHARDTFWTERLDYHFATIHMATFLLLALVRLALLVKGPQTARSVLKLAGLALGLWIARHLWYLNFVFFDYGYNMVATAVVVVLQALAWVVWAVFARSRGAPHWAMICKFQTLLLTFGLCEAFDFPPVWGWLDAHACWHGLTIGLVFYWYAFLQQDAKWRRKQGNSVV